MFSKKFSSGVAFFVFAIVFSASSAGQKPSSTAPAGASETWVTVDEADWAVYMDAPAYHFGLAKEYLQKGDVSKAASELKRGETFLTFQKNRIASASKQIEELAASISAGKEKDTSKLDAVTSNALKVISHKYALMPVEIEPAAVFTNAYEYHFEKAKSELREDNRAGAALEIRRAASFLRLQAARSGHAVKAELDSVGTELKDLASKVEYGTVKDVKELNKVFQRAISAVTNKKE